MNSALKKANAKAHELEELLTLFLLKKCAECPEINNIEHCAHCDDIDYVRVSNALDFVRMAQESLEPLYSDRPDVSF
ncbi:MAG: hypothetical protein ACTSYA_01215 [Candidatus Kariarchaeaceae archaeon]